MSLDQYRNVLLRVHSMVRSRVNADEEESVGTQNGTGSENEIFSLLFLPWPCATVAAAHAGAAGRGSSRRPGPPEASGSHSTPCRGPPCTCGESAGNLPYPAGGGGGKDWLVRLRTEGEEMKMCGKRTADR